MACCESAPNGCHRPSHPGGPCVPSAPATGLAEGGSGGPLCPGQRLHGDTCSGRTAAAGPCRPRRCTAAALRLVCLPQRPPRPSITGTRYHPQILSQARNPLAVQPHLRKCFEAISTLDFGPAPELEISAMNSAEGEKVRKGLRGAQACSTTVRLGARHRCFGRLLDAAAATAHHPGSPAYWLTGRRCW